MKMPFMVIPDDEPPEMAGTPSLERLKKYGEVKLYDNRPASPAELLERVQPADIVVNIRAFCKFTSELMGQCKNLRMISVLGTGVDNVELAAAKSLGITVTNTPNITTLQVAEHALTLMLAVARQVVIKDKAVKKGRWGRAPFMQLYGKTLGILGTGLIGQRVAQLARGIGMKVVAWTVHPSPERAQEYGVEFLPLDDLLRQADVISVHLRQSKDTIGFIGRRELNLMKPTAILINTARGPISDEMALAEALAQRRIAGAGIDIFQTEPLPGDHPFTKLDNVILSPHNAGMTPEAMLAGTDCTVDNVINFLQGKPTNVVA